MNGFAVETIFKAVDNISSPLKNISAKLGGVQATMASLIPGGTALNNMLNSVAGQVAIGSLAAKGFTAAWGMVKNTVSSIPEFANAADAIGKQSQTLGIGAEALQRFNYAAEMSGVSNEALSKSFATLNKGIGSGSLMNSLKDLDQGLASQIKTAGNTQDAFMIIADAVANESDVARRSAILNATLGKSAAGMVPMLADGAEGLREMMALAPNVLSNRTVATATVFGDTLTHINGVLKDFGDTAKSGVMSAILPYVYALKEWLDTNKELVKIKIQEFIQGAIGLMEKLRPTVLKIIDTVQGVIETVKPFAMWVIDNLPKIIPIVTGVVGAFMAFSLVRGVIAGVTGALDGFLKILGMGPIGIVFLVITALIAGFTFLSSKVGGVENALELLQDALVTTGQTIMRFLLTPLNMTIDAIQGVLFAIGSVTKAKWAIDASEQLGAFQDKMNALLTGTTNTFLENGLAATYGDIPGNFGKIGDKYNTMVASVTPQTNDDSGWQAILDKLDGVITAQEGTTAAVEDTASTRAKSSAPGLNYAASGHADVFGTVRAGL
ncbi:hypothetical protein FACS1894109_13190 [Spirochaetia bacterium]|nr:hypothetical protein FACS1894109_13190 [Spirochaetia bacterium]